MKSILKKGTTNQSNFMINEWKNTTIHRITIHHKISHTSIKTYRTHSFTSLFMKHIQNNGKIRKYYKKIAPMILQKRHASNLKSLKDRMRGIKAVEGVTNTMKMTAQTKKTKASEELESIKPFFEGIMRFFTDIKLGKQFVLKSDTEEEREKLITEIKDHFDGKKVCVFVMNTERGLCGPVNVTINRNVRMYHPAEAIHVISGMGNKIGTFGQDERYGEKMHISIYQGGKENVTFDEFSEALNEIIKEHEKDIDQFVIYYPHSNRSSYKVSMISLPSAKTLLQRPEDFIKWEYEEHADSFFPDLYEFAITTSLHYAYYHTKASELNSRFEAMDNASNNAKDIYAELSMTYNKTRQLLITTELLELVGGAEVVKEMVGDN